MTVDQQLISSIGRGVLVLAAVGKGDTEKEADTLVSKILKLRLWQDDGGAMVRLFYPRKVSFLRGGCRLSVYSGRRACRMSTEKCCAVCWMVLSVAMPLSDCILL